MDDIELYIDLGNRKTEARIFKRDNPDMALSDFLCAFPAYFPKDGLPTEDSLKLPLERFFFQPVKVKEGGVLVPPAGQGDGGLGADIDKLWKDEQEGSSGPAWEEAELEKFPEKITDNEAVRTAYRPDMDTISDFLKNDLSVLVVCDKMLTEYIYEFVCHRAGKKVVLDTNEPEGQARNQGMGGRMDEAMHGGQGNALENLPSLIHNLRNDQILVFRSLDMLDNPPTIELLYQRTGSGEKPHFLAFLDPSLEAKKVLTDRFAVHVSIMGLLRYSAGGENRAEYTVTRLLTRKERACFKPYEPEGLYKNVAGLNAIQFRNAMRYVGAKVVDGTEPKKIYRVIRQFKTSSSGEIEIPDTTFKDIGGYEHVKQELMRVVSLIAGPVQDLDEKMRGSLIPRGFIFHGPPGTGKTLFAKAIANEMNATIQMVSGPEIMDKYVGQSENNIRRLFAVARRNAPAVIFFDEFDSIVSQRSSYSDGGARVNNAVVAQFLTELDGFRQEQAVLVIGTTNRIDIIDEALLRPSRLTAMKIGLPDYDARKHVAGIHAKNFGLDRLLSGLCSLTSKYRKDWEKSGPADGEREIPEAFRNELFAQHEPFRKRYEIEGQQAGFLRDLQAFFGFVNKLRDKTDGKGDTKLMEQMEEKVIALGKRYGLDLGQEGLPDLNSPEAENRLMPMQSDICDIFDLLHQERTKSQGVTPEVFLSSLLDLVAEYTVNFNNDEIRAIFQEARMEHHMKGQLITPRFLGEKIGMIRKRRDEKEEVHLSSERGR